MRSATVVAPGHSKVVPLTPEFIAPEDRAEKQDCERNAVRRWFEKHSARLAPLRPAFLSDDLFACHPVAEMVTDAGDDFIFTCKPTSHKTLYDFIDGAEFRRHEEKVRRRNTKETFRYRWIEAVPLRDGRDAMLDNWIGFEILDAKGKVKYSMAWVTAVPRQCRRDCRLRPSALENRERELQRTQKPRIRTRAQFRPWPDVSRDDAGGPQSARLSPGTPYSNCSSRLGSPLAKRRSSGSASSPTILTLSASFRPGRLSSNRSPPSQSRRTSARDSP